VIDVGVAVGLALPSSTRSQCGSRESLRVRTDADIVFSSTGEASPILRRAIPASENDLPILYDCPEMPGTSNTFIDRPTYWSRSVGGASWAMTAIRIGRNSPQELLNRLMAGLDLFVGNTPQHDDVTCMLLKA
jgi:hypothetical protein